MACYYNRDGVLRTVDKIYDNIGGVLREVSKGYDNIGGTLREYHSAGTLLYDNGVDYTNITGGWALHNVTEMVDHMYFRCRMQGRLTQAWVTSNNYIAIENKKICMELEPTDISGSGFMLIRCHSISGTYETTQLIDQVRDTPTQIVVKRYTVSTPVFNGSYTIEPVINVGIYWKVYKIWLE